MFKHFALLCLLVAVAYANDANTEDSNTFVKRNTLFKGQLQGGLPGTCWMGNVYQSGPAARLDHIQFHIDLRPKCQIENAQPCNLPIPTTFTGGNGGTLTSLAVLLVRIQSGMLPSCSDIAPLLSTLAGPQPNTNQINCFVNGGSGLACPGPNYYNPLYRYVDNLIWAKTFYPDDVIKVAGQNFEGVNRYIANYNSKEDPDFKPLNLDEGDSIFALVAYSSNWAQFQSFGGFLLNGHFNHKLSSADTLTRQIKFDAHTERHQARLDKL